MKKLLEILVAFIILFLISGFNIAKAQQIPPIFIAEVKLGENVYVKSDKVEDSDVISIGGDIYIDGMVHGGIMAVGGNIYVNGNVDGNATSVGGQVIINKSGKVLGEVSELGKHIRKLTDFNYGDMLYSNKYKSFKINIFIFVTLCLISMVIYKSSSKNIIEISSNLKNTLKRDFICGYFSLVIILFTIAALVLTILGVFIVPLFLLVIFIIYMIGFTSICMNIGKQICIKLEKDLSPVLYIIIGLSICYTLINLIFPTASIIILVFLIIPISIGTSINSRFGTFKSWKKDDVEKWNWYKQK